MNISKVEISCINSRENHSPSRYARPLCSALKENFYFNPKGQSLAQLKEGPKYKIRMVLNEDGDELFIRIQEDTPEEDEPVNDDKLHKFFFNVSALPQREWRTYCTISRKKLNSEYRRAQLHADLTYAALEQLESFGLTSAFSGHNRVLLFKVFISFLNEQHELYTRPMDRGFGMNT